MFSKLMQVNQSSASIFTPLKPTHSPNHNLFGDEEADLKQSFP